MPAAATHKGRNIIDDIIDLVVLIGGLLYFLFGEKIGLVFTDRELTVIITTGAAIRVLLRKILMRFVGLDLAGTDTAPALAPAPSDDSEPPSKTPTLTDDDDTPDKPIAPPPPTVGAP